MSLIHFFTLAQFLKKIDENQVCDVIKLGPTAELLAVAPTVTNHDHLKLAFLLAAGKTAGFSLVNNYKLPKYF